MRATTYIEPTAADLRELLGWISPDAPREDWVKALMAIKAALDDDGFEIVDEWSQRSDKYRAADMRATWRSIKPHGGVTIGTLIHMAMAAGWRPSDKTPQEPPQRTQKPLQRVQQPVQASALARQIADAVPLTDPRAKPVLDYLENRLGCIPDELPRLGCIPLCRYYEDRKHLGDYPVMLALLRDCTGRVVQAQRTYISEGKKAPVSAPKKLLPGTWPRGAAVWLYSCTAARLIVGEGIETTLALRQKLGNFPAWALLSDQNLKRAVIPFDVAELDVAVDRDDLVSGSFAGPRASFELRQRMKPYYTRTRLHAPPRGVKDWADVAEVSNGR